MSGSAATSAQRSELLRRCLRAFNVRGIEYCLLHGHKNLGGETGGDIDCVVSQAHVPEGVIETLLGAGFIVLQHVQHEATGHALYVAHPDFPTDVFLHLDVSSDFRRDGRVFYSGGEFLRRKRNSEGLWVPDPALEFGSYLVKKICKRDLSAAHWDRLSTLYVEDPGGCQKELERFWGPRSIQALSSAARTGVWKPVQQNVDLFRAELLRNTAIAHPVRTLRYRISDMARLWKRWTRPVGLYVVVLGADEAQRTAVVRGIRQTLVAPLMRSESPPALQRLLAFSSPLRLSADQLQPSRRLHRGAMANVAIRPLLSRIGCALAVRPVISRSSLVLVDHALTVDMVNSTSQFQSRSLVEPDLVILLDTNRVPLLSNGHNLSSCRYPHQRHACNCRVIDARRPNHDVIDDANRLIVTCLTGKTTHRLGGTLTTSAAGVKAIASEHTTTLERPSESIDTNAPLGPTPRDPKARRLGHAAGHRSDGQSIPTKGLSRIRFLARVYVAVISSLRKGV